MAQSGHAFLSHTATTPDDPADDADRQPVRVVGVGSSAGGLDAMLDLFGEMPPLPVAFLVLQHTAIEHGDLLRRLLHERTSYAVKTPYSGNELEAFNIYICPPGATLSLRENKLEFISNVAQPVTLPIDRLFDSLARNAGAKSIGVLLSGTGRDGAQGMQAIRAARGTTFAQSPGSALFAGMPQAAIDDAVVDLVLDPQDIAIAIDAVVKLPNSSSGPEKATGTLWGSQARQKQVAALVRDAYRAEIGHYKESTVRRRLARRMKARSIDDVATYAALLQSDRNELGQFYQDLLISVTSFFRDAVIFEHLKRHALAPLVAQGGPLRFWAPGCSTGQEAYTLAILVHELAGDEAAKLNLKIFATDVDESALLVGKRGAYPNNIALDVSQARLAAYFEKIEDGYKIRPEVRNHVVFSRQDALTDPPFAGIHLISCRNMLIYMTAEAQQKALRLFRQTLRRGGLLLLGSAESLNGCEALYEPIDAPKRIYRAASSVAKRGQAELDQDLLQSDLKAHGWNLGATQMHPQPADAVTNSRQKDSSTSPIPGAKSAMGEAALDPAAYTVADLPKLIKNLRDTQHRLHRMHDALDYAKAEAQSHFEALAVANDEVSKSLSQLSLCQDELASFFNVSDDVILIVDLDGTVRQFTQKSPAMLLSSAERDHAAIRRDLQALLDTAALQQPIAQSLRHGRKLKLSYNNHLKLPMLLEVEPYKGSDYAIIGVALKFVPMAPAWKTGVVSAKEGSEFAATMWQKEPCPILVVSSELKALWANDLCLGSIGITMRDLFGLGIKDMAVVAADGDYFTALMQDILKTGLSARRPTWPNVVVDNSHYDYVKISRTTMPAGLPLLVLKFERPL